MGGHGNRGQIEMAILWILNLSDGDNDLLNIAGQSGLSFNIIAEAADLMVSKQLIKSV
jgi:aminopeptidase-like protein